MTATSTCITCGAELQSSAKFCSECGTAVSAASKPAEYKQVTVLFADVVHSMNIAATVMAFGVALMHRHTPAERERGCEILTAVDHLFRDGRPLIYGVATTGVLVQTLLDRWTDDDVDEAKAAIDHLARTPTEGVVVRDIWLLQMQALLAKAQGDPAAYKDFRDRYRDMAKTLEFEGHIDWAEAVP